MSRLVDQQRREDALHAKIDGAKEVLRQLGQVVTFTLEGVPKAEQARRLGIGRPLLDWFHTVLKLNPRPEASLRWRLRGAAKREVRDGCEAET